MLRVGKFVALVTVALVAAGSAMAQVRAQRGSERVQKTGGTTLRLASDTALPGYERFQYDGNRVVYVSPKVQLTGKDIASAEALVADSAGSVALTLTRNAIARSAGDVEGRLAVFVNGVLVAAPAVISRGATGTLVLTGISAEKAARIVKALSPATIAPAGPILSVVPTQMLAAPGELVSVDVVVGSVADLRGIQVAVDATGGQAGRLELEDVSIDIMRPDYLFANDQALNATDVYRGRAVSVLYDGLVSVMQPAYVATYTFRVSPEANGVFQIQVRRDADTALRRAIGEPVAYQVGPAAQITVR